MSIVPEAQATQDTQAPDPMQDPDKRQRVELAKNFVSQLLKGIKQIGMYRHNEAKFPEFLHSAHEAIEQYTSAHGPLSMKVEPQNFPLFNQPLSAEESQLPYKFIKDGFRQLIFSPGLPVDEMVSFTIVALSHPERESDFLTAHLF